MKKIFFASIALLSLPVFGQIQQNVNKTSGTETNPITEIDSIRFNVGSTQMEIISTNGNVESHTISDINNVTFSGQLIGGITALNCAGATITGTLVEGIAASGVSADINYTGGNGGAHNGQVVASTGVTGLTATLTAGNFANGAGTLTYTITGTPSASGTASFAINIGGMTCSLQITVNGGSISTLDCAGATINGTLVEGLAASGVSADINYTGGNGGTHNGQVVTSTGVTGLTATLNAGNFANGSGTLNYTITGTPSASGTASFAINMGGMTCALEVTVNGGAVTTLNCAGATITGTLVNGVAASGVSADIAYTGGNGGTHNGQTVISTGVTGLTATLTSGNFANGAGTLNYTITGTPNASGTANFAINIGGTTCSLQITVNGGSVSTLDCAGATVTGTLVNGVAASGVSADIDYTGGNGGTHNGQVVTSTGVIGLTATLTVGNFATGAGTLTYAISGTPSANGTASFAINMGGMTCSLQIPVNGGAVSTLDCSGATINGTLVEGVAASGVSADIDYTGGNGGTHNGQVVTSTGVTGLTATLTAGNFANGAGTLTYTITGTPNASGTASFAINMGGMSCSLQMTVASAGPTYPAGTVHCTGTPTAIVDVTNPTTGRTWMDRNLGASQAATSSTNTSSYGDLYQWGRGADGHQCRTSPTTITLSSTDQPGHGNFILASSNPWDWRSPQNDNLWQGVNGVNNPCPSGYRLPTDAELQAERATWSSNNDVGAFASTLKLPKAGTRHYDGLLYNQHTSGVIWSSTIFSGYPDMHWLFYNTSNAGLTFAQRAIAASVRCIKD